MSVSVFVLDRKHRPLMPCRPARARRLLKSGRARVVKRFPFTIRLVDRLIENSDVQPVLVKFDPGSRETGIAVVRADGKRRHHALFFIDLVHRGSVIRECLSARRAFGRRRRSNLRYRAPRFLNRTKPQGWPAPSLRHRVDAVAAWAAKLIRLVPATGLVEELVKFDAQKLQNPEISGAEYQQGTLFGYEVREYLLEKFGKKCVYCSAENVPLNIEHVVPKARGGSNRLSNLALACVACNQKKGAQPVEVFLKDRPEVLERLKQQCRRSLSDAAAVNATRWSLLNALKTFELPVQTGSGALTIFNRSSLGIAKEHWLDALCAGRINAAHYPKSMGILEVRCTGRGSYQRTRLTKHGFPRGFLMRQKRVHGFATGDMVKAIVPSGKKAGVYQGRVAVRASGRFNIQTPEGVIQGISWRHCQLLSYNDGYGYAWLRRAPHSSPV